MQKKICVMAGMIFFIFILGDVLSGDVELGKEHSADSSTVLLMHFNEGNGNPQDSSGQGNHGTNHGATWTTAGKLGNALSFDGIGDYVEVADSASLDITDAITIEALVKLRATGRNYLVNKEDAWGMKIFDNAKNIALFTPGTSGGALVTTDEITLNKWAHIAATYDGVHRRIYIDGVEVKSDTQSGSMDTSTGNLFIGDYSGHGYSFNGTIDEVRISNRALTAEEIKNNYKNVNRREYAKGQDEKAAIIDIGSRLELFVDEYLIEKLNGAQLRLHKPTPREVAIIHNEQWEGRGCHYNTVFQDGDIYRMYYRGLHNKLRGSEKKRHQFACYAESKDGIHWIKPELGLVEYEGSKKNNIIVWGNAGTHVRKGTGTAVGVHNFTPFKDANPNCKPDEKYKAIGGGNRTTGLCAFKSSDGIHWSLMQEKPIITEGAFDSQNLAFYDTIRGRYVCYSRIGGPWGRAIQRHISQDFREWTTRHLLIYEKDTLPVQMYTNAIQPYFRAPHIFIGFPKRFVPNRTVAWGRPSGISDSLFMTSRDGLNFKCWNEAVIRPGPQKERWVTRNNLVAWGILETQSAIPGTPNELSIYSIEGAGMGEDCSERRYTYRIDGFVSVQAPLKGGEMVTKPLKFQGKQLVINFSTSAAGSIRVEIQSATGEPIPGFKISDCPDIYGDSIEKIVKWKTGSDVTRLEGKPVRLRFLIKDADLYSMQFR